MTDQSRRAQQFRRQLWWFKIRGQFAEPAPPIVMSSEEPPEPAQQA